MKTWVKVVLGIVAVIGVAIGAVFYLTAGMVDTADGFFTAVKQDDMTKARTYLAETFKARTDEKTLKEFLAKSALTKFKEASWGNRQISGGRGELEGTVTTETGGTIPIKLTLVKENDTWKIFQLEKPAAGLQTENASPSAPQQAGTSKLTGAPSVPEKAGAIALVKQSLHDFIVSADKKSMEHFRDSISSLWRKQVTTAQLDEAFKPLTESGADWSVLENFDPIFSSDGAIDEDGVLLLTGYYATKPSQVSFKQKFIREGDTWKLIGFQIDAK
ncbi:hypothetical protein [uncultured Thiodictyon sp.]|uniref:hypothetical protein n=1 Tax=uncultured Thiodictyon sp. TaxID=1846217 RepID=UPI0025DF1F64|nr:hypothetical protein [uncultured Thiodictyon sp.]